MTKLPLNRGLLRGLAALCIVAALSGCGGPNIWDSAAFGNLDDVKLLVEKNPELVNARNKNDKTPLFFAVAMNRADVFEYLVAQGADIHAADMTGLTPLHVSAFTSRYKNSSGLAERLVELGADLEAKDKFGDTPLHVAAYKNNTGFIDMLVTKLGSDVDARNNENLTPLEVAQKYEQADAVAKLRSIQESAT